MAVRGDQPERRRRFRRAEDRERASALQRRPNQTVRRAAVGLLAVVAVVLAYAVVALAIGTVNDHRAVAKAQEVERQACHRLNVHRVEQDDANWYREWRFDKFFLQALLHPLPGAARPTRAQERQREIAIADLQAIVGGVTWTPATSDCVNPGGGAAPIRFSVRQPTPAQLQLRPGQ